MSTTTRVPVEEYLSKSWSPDRDYVDGRLVERNAGELHHSYLQGLFGRLLERHGLFTFPELRVQVKANRFRCPDVLATRVMPNTRYIRTRPYIVVEVLSREDRKSDVDQAIDDYLEFGIPNIWVVDPSRRRIAGHDRAGSRNFVERVETSDGEISIPLDEIFGNLPVIED